MIYSLLTLTIVLVTESVMCLLSGDEDNKQRDKENEVHNIYTYIVK
jgi:hypothetical protein